MHTCIILLAKADPSVRLLVCVCVCKCVRERQLAPTSLMNESCHTYECVMSHIRMHHLTHMNEACDAHERIAWHI